MSRNGQLRFDIPASFGAVAVGSFEMPSRLWTTETGMSFGYWRAQLRIRCALAYLSEARTVSEVAGLVGYESTSAFVAAFRRRIGVPPGSYFEGSSSRSSG